ncbi:MAG: hypothetical protein R3B06_11455 [Kofleriaceae bacterium]
MPPPHPPGRHVPSSAITSFIVPSEIEALLAPWLAEPADRAFVARCILAEGPAHHRGTNFVLLRLLGLLAQRHAPTTPLGPTVAVPIRLPPRLAAGHDDADYPLAFPRRVLERLAPPGSPTLDAMVDCVTDGPPQHALANAAMLCLLDALLASAEPPA